MLVLKNKKKNLYTFSKSKMEKAGHLNDHTKAKLNFANVNNSVSDIWYSLMILWVRKGLGSLVLPSRAHTHTLSGIFNLTPIYIYLSLWQLSPGIRISSMLEPSLHQMNIHQWPLGSHNVKPQLLLNSHPSPATFKPLKLVPYGTVLHITKFVFHLQEKLWFPWP